MPYQSGPERQLTPEGSDSDWRWQQTPAALQTAPTAKQMEAVHTPRKCLHLLLMLSTLVVHLLIKEIPHILQQGSHIISPRSPLRGWVGGIAAVFVARWHVRRSQ